MMGCLDSRGLDDETQDLASAPTRTGSHCGAEDMAVSTYLVQEASCRAPSKRLGVTESRFRTDPSQYVCFCKLEGPFVGVLWLGARLYGVYIRARDFL